MPAAPIWEPSPERAAASRLCDYARSVGRGDDAYGDLWRWSVDAPSEFWASVWDYFAIDASRGYDAVMSGIEMPGTRWFPGAELSYARHVFRDRDPHAVAIVGVSEAGAREELSWAELGNRTARIRAGLVACGVGQGDTVAAYLPNVPETVAAFLACASLGATWSLVSPEFGPGGAVDRFAQVEPVVLLAVDGYRYNGVEYDRREAVAELREALPTVRRTFVLRSLAGDGGWESLDGDDGLEREGELEFAELPFEHPLWVLYTSGTTGRPKGIVHGQGGVLLEHLKTLAFHFDLGPSDRLFWSTTTGWMMWNLLVGGLLTGATVVLYDGSATFSGLGRLWEIAGAEQVTCFGTGASYLHTCMRGGLETDRLLDLSSVRTVGSTGSPLSPDGFRWVYSHVGRDVWLVSTSGGTDLCTAFVGGVPTLPVVAGELQAPSLGARVESWDAEGRPAIGRVGELVLTAPMPSMPLRLVGDVDGTRLRESYFATFPGVWRHGDWIELTERGSAIISGRSDSTINRGGVRIGTAELYRAVLGSDRVRDALALDLPREGRDGSIVLYVALVDGAEPTPELEAQLRALVRNECSPRHVPDEIRVIPDIPRTLSGKTLEIPIRRILLGERPEGVVDPNSLANPEALAYFVT